MMRLAPLSLILITLSCSSPKKEKDIAKQEAVAKQAGVSLREFSIGFNAAVQNAAGRLARETQDRRVRRMLIVWQMRILTLTRNAVARPDPRWALIDLWTLAHQQLHLFEKRGEEMLGEKQGVALEACEGIVDTFEGRAAVIFGQEVFDETRAAVVKFAEEHPITDTGFRQSQSPYELQAGDAKASGGGFGKVLTAPLGIFDIGVKDTARSISDIAKVLDRTTAFVEDMPTEMRWQTELLIFDLDEAPTVQQLLKDSASVTASVAAFQKTADDLPTRVRTEVTELLQDDGLQKTMQEAQTTIKEVDVALKQAEITIKEVQEAGDSLTRTSQALEPTLKVLDNIVNPPKDPDAVPGPAFDFKDVVKASENFNVLAVELKKVLDDVNALIEGDGISKRVDDIDRVAQKAVLHGEGFVDHITLRMMLVIVVFFAALFGYKLGVRKLGS
ncbi:MAG: hypothetical protein ACYTGN_14275 [Planctomycetota bacterium]|jgi:hypothetical protein